MKERFERVSKISLKIITRLSWRLGGGALRYGMREWVPIADPRMPTSMMTDPMIP